jgi:[ribosomal protein S18]-alanine N-acetyltransferase
MTMSVRICEINSGDIAELIALGSEANLSPWSAQNYIDELQNPQAIMLRMNSDENALVGFIVGRVVAAADSADAVDAEIYNIAVARQFRGGGHGQTLFDEFLNRSSRKFARNVWLEVRESNAPAIAFYRKNGFQIVTRRRAFYSDPVEDAFLMRMDLAGRGKQLT